MDRKLREDGEVSIRFSLERPLSHCDPCLLNVFHWLRASAGSETSLLFCFLSAVTICGAFSSLSLNEDRETVSQLGPHSVRCCRRFPKARVFLKAGS